MRNEFTAIIEKEAGWYIGYCPEIPGANGQGRTIKQCRKSLAQAIALILEDRREDGLRGVPKSAIARWLLLNDSDSPERTVRPVRRLAKRFEQISAPVEKLM